MIAKSNDWFEITPTGLVVTGDMSEDRWRELGSQLAANYRSMMWLIGDWINAGTNAGYLPRGRLAEAVDAFGISIDQARDASSVCSRIESAYRHAHLSYGHHRAVAGRGDAGELLKWAYDNKASVNDLRDEKKRRDQPKIVPSSPVEQEPAKQASLIGHSKAKPVQPAPESIHLEQDPIQPSVQPAALIEVKPVDQVQTMNKILELLRTLSPENLHRMRMATDRMDDAVNPPQAIATVPAVEPAPGMLIPFDPLDVKFPPKLDTPKFRVMWAKWVAFNAKRDEPIDELVADAQLKTLNARSLEAAISALEKAIARRTTVIPEARESRPAFVPPTIEEIDAYLKEVGPVDFTAEHFYHTYNKDGWTIKSGKKMTDWKSAVHTWKSRNKAAQAAAQPKPELSIESAFKAITIPPKFNTQEFFKTLCDWGKVQQSNGRTPSVTAMQTIVDKLADFSLRRALGHLREWIAANRFKPIYDDSYEAYQPAESEVWKPARNYEVKSLLNPGRSN